jgi:hypothetical protein
MSRRAIPWTFFVGALLSMVLLIADTVRASKPAARVPNVLGHWDGYFLEAGGTAAPGLVRSDITLQHNRGIAGHGQLLDAATDARLAAYSFAGTIGSDDDVAARGRTPVGRVSLEADLQLFAGRRGDAGVMDAQVLFVPRHGLPSPVGAILLHPFPHQNAPDISGEGLGVFRSQLDATFAGGLALQIQPRERGGFPGLVSFMPDTSLHAPFTWQSRATISDQGRLIMIAQGKTGRMMVDGAVFPRSKGAPSAAVDGLYTLILNDGRHDFGFYNFNLAPRIP